MIKRILGLLLLSSCVYGFNPVQYVQISTSVQPSLQAGQINISTATISSATISNLTITTMTVTSSATITGALAVSTMNATNQYQKNGVNGYLLLYSSTVFDSSGSTTTTSTSYIATKTAITVTPSATTNRVEISWSGCLSSANSSGRAQATLNRGLTNLTADHTCSTFPSAAAVGTASCSGDIIDLPLTASATTYTIYMRNDGSQTTTWGDTAGTACLPTITAKIWGY